MICTAHQILFEKNEMDGACSACGDGRGVYRVWSGKMRERDYLVDLSVEGRIILRWIFRKWDVGLWTGSSWLMIGTAAGHL